MDSVLFILAVFFLGYIALGATAVCFVFYGLWALWRSIR